LTRVTFLCPLPSIFTLFISYLFLTGPGGRQMTIDFLHGRTEAKGPYGGPRRVGYGISYADGSHPPGPPGLLTFPIFFSVYFSCSSFSFLILFILRPLEIRLVSFSSLSSSSPAAPLSFPVPQARALCPPASHLPQPFCRYLPFAPLRPSRLRKQREKNGGTTNNSRGGGLQ
jgi:hypothetical protein